MCGIVGTTDRRDHRSLGAMLGLMHHRGPDDAGRYVDDATGVAIAMRRLSILDVHSGHQPMSNEDGTIWIVFNGEIYNSPELRRELEQKGHVFRTRHSDTECLVHLFEDYGAGMLARLNGMFAFVIYDARRKCLFGARDRAGIKPLYYVERQGRFAFASELKCLRALPDVSSALDPASLMHYLSLQFVPAPRTALRDVRKLPAGFCFHYHLEQRSLVTERYWHLPVRPRHDRSREEVVAELRSRLEQAVLRQTLSDVPIACSLSGGLDSSAIVGILAQHSGERLRTYSVGFAGPGTDSENELPLAREVAALWQTDHTEIIVEPTQVLQDLHRMVYHLDEPYGGSLPSWYIYEAVGRDCKVALTGTGGDELFGNYQKWKVHEHGGLRRVWDIWRQAFRWGQAGILVDGWRYPQGVLFHQYLPDAVKSRLLRLPVASERAGPTASLLQAHWNGASMSSPRDTVACMDFQLQLPEEFLAVTDRFSMAHSVEARVPFLDHELVELAFTVPAAWRTRRGDPKYLAREIVRPFLPPELLSASKRGFVLPLTRWTRHELRGLITDELSPTALQHHELLTGEVWTRIVNPHLQGKRDFTQQVWTLLMFQLWCRSVRNIAGAIPEPFTFPRSTENRAA